MNGVRGGVGLLMLPITVMVQASEITGDMSCTSFAPSDCGCMTLPSSEGRCMTPFLFWCMQRDLPCSGLLDVFRLRQGAAAAADLPGALNQLSPAP